MDTAVAAIVQQTISESLPDGIEIQTLYTMELQPSNADDDYLSMMGKNLEALKAGLGC